ncbi:MAG: YfhO family protein [Armatimonadetes bacterium]|nr:YfhO family protein [Armatimonadota bacterium]
MKLKPLLPYALFLILVCTFLWRPIFKGEALLPGDYLAQMSPWNSVVKTSNPPPQWNPLQWDAIAQFYPWRVFYARSMHAGHLPLWNPHQFCGTPFLANGQSAALYPPNLVFLVFDAITAFTVFAALHLFLAQVFMYWLMRGLGCKELGGIVGAICFAFSAFMALWLELPTFVAVAVWLPLVLLLIHKCVERKSVFYGMLAGGALALSFLAGHLQIAFYVTLAAMLWWVWLMAGAWRSEGGAAFRRVLISCAACFAIAGLIASAQALPTIELGANSPRAAAPSADGYKWFIGNAIKPYRLVTAFAPDFYGNPSKNTYFLLGMLDGHAGSAADYMEYGLYIGILPLILAAIGLGSIRKRRYVGFFGALAVFALLVATGTVINVLFYYLIPGFSAFGGPNRILLLYLFGVAGLAGFGIDNFVEHSVEQTIWRGKSVSRGTIWTIWLLLAVGLVFALCHSVAVRFVEELTGEHYDGIVGAIGLVPIMILFSSALALVAFASDALSRKSFFVLAILLIVADLFAFGLNYNPTCSRDKVYPETKLTTELKRLSKVFGRVAPINPSWSLFETPKAILPPNAAMVYGYSDVQGYDSLYTKDYKLLMTQVEGIDPSPPENGNMILVRRFPGGKHIAGLIVTRDDLSKWTTNQLPSNILTLVGVYDGIRVYVRFPARAWARMWPRHITSSFAWEGSRGVVGNFLPEGGFFTPPIRYGEPAWVARLNGKRLPIERWQNNHVAVRATGPGVLAFSYEPFSFRIGLFLMLVGFGALSGVGVYRAVQYRNLAKR